MRQAPVSDLFSQYSCAGDDVCIPNQCVHGSCNALGSVRFTCSCDGGWVGQLCNTDIGKMKTEEFLKRRYFLGPKDKYSQIDALCPSMTRMWWYWITPHITKFMGPTWGPPGCCWPQMGPMLAPWTFLSGYSNIAWSKRGIAARIWSIYVIWWSRAPLVHVMACGLFQCQDIKFRYWHFQS